MPKAAAFDVGEFARFVASGLAAACGNFAVVWLVRLCQPFAIALLAGIAAGLIISFVLTKWFAFGSRSFDQTRGEATRFLIVYAIGCVAYWVVAMVTRSLVHRYGWSIGLAEAGSVLFAAAAMMFTNYFGHRLFTYKTHKSTDQLFATNSQ